MMINTSIKPSIVLPEYSPRSEFKRCAVDARYPESSPG